MTIEIRSQNIRCGPENCPLTAWTVLSARERKVQRKALGQKLYQQGFTIEAIARQFRAAYSTIHDDLRDMDISSVPMKKSLKRGRRQGTRYPRKRNGEAREAKPSMEVYKDGRWHKVRGEVMPALMSRVHYAAEAAVDLKAVCESHPEEITKEVIDEVRAVVKAWTHLAKALRRRNAHGKKTSKTSKKNSARVPIQVP